MDNPFNIASQLILGLVSGILTVPLISSFIYLYKRFRTRHLRKFWKPFIGQRLAIILNEYLVNVDNQFEGTVQEAVGVGGFLISRGNALALSNLLNFIPDNITKGHNLIVGGDKSGIPNFENLIILGSPVNHLYAQNVFSSLAERFTIPYEVVFNSSTETITIKSKDGIREYLPKIIGGNGVDYALIIRARYRNYPSGYAISWPVHIC